MIKFLPSILLSLYVGLSDEALLVSKEIVEKGLRVKGQRSSFASQKVILQRQLLVIS